MDGELPDVCSLEGWVSELGNRTDLEVTQLKEIGIWLWGWDGQSRKEEEKLEQEGSSLALGGDRKILERMKVSDVTGNWEPTSCVKTLPKQLLHLSVQRKIPGTWRSIVETENQKTDCISTH